MVPAPPSSEVEIDGFIAKYSPAVAGQLRAARSRLQGLFPHGYELIYDNYNALVFGFSPSLRTSEAVLSLAGYPKWITLFFLHGASLEDPAHLLVGSGSQVRSIRLPSAQELDRSEVRSLIAQAVAPLRPAFEQAPALSVVIKSVSAKQRPRRPEQG